MSEPARIASYRLDESTVVRFEYEPAEGFHAASPGQIAGHIQDAVSPAIAAAKLVLDKIRDMRPDHVEMTFGIKVSGGTSWVVAKAAAEANFSVTLSWQPGGPEPASAAVPATGEITEASESTGQGGEAEAGQAE
jgi:hypothetical protein